MLANTASLVLPVLGIILPMVALSQRVFPVTAITMPIYVTLKQEDVFVNTILPVTLVNDVLRATMAVLLEGHLMIVSHVHAQMEVLAFHFQMKLLFAWNVLKDMLGLAVNYVPTDSLGIPKDVMVLLGHANDVTVMVTLIPMPLQIATERPESVSNVFTTLEGSTAINVFQGSLVMLWHFQRVTAVIAIVMRTAL